MTGYESQPVDTDSSSHLALITSNFQESMNVHHGTGVSAALTLHQFFDIYSNMTWFFAPIKSTDTNSALFPDISALAHWQ